MASDATAPSTRFFVMRKLDEGAHDVEFAESDNSNDGPAPRCPECGEFVGMLTWLPPHVGDLEVYGKDFPDLMKGPGYHLLVTERFAEDFKAEGLTGLSGFDPVVVLRVRRKRRGPKLGPPPVYLVVSAAYGNAALDMERSRILSKDPLKCNWCRYRGTDAVDGLALEEGTWKGEDIFRPRGLAGHVIVTERFMRFAERHAMSNMSFVPIEKYVWDPSGLIYPHSTQSDPPNKG